METVKCGYCKKDVKKYRSELKRYPNSFCSRNCKYEWNKTVEGYWKGKTIPYFKRPNRNVRGKNNPRWKGGKRIDKDGYVLIWMPTHPYADYHGYVREHRLVLERKLNRYLLPREAVHHIDHAKTNNAISNLELCTDGGEHQRIHYREGSGAAKFLKHSPAWKSENP